MNTIRCILFVLLSMPIGGFANTLDNTRAYNYYDTPDVCKGWHCYEDTIVPPQEEKVVTSKEFTGNVDWDVVWTMPSADMRALINDAMDWVQQDPTPQKMEVYLKLQGVAMRRAKKFQEVWDEVVLANPVLDETVRRSPTTLGSSLEAIEERNNRAEVIGQMSQDMGLIYFYSPSCSYCEKEKDILNEFMEKWSWTNITAINIKENSIVAQEYGVQTVPDLWVVGNTKDGVQQRRLKAGLASHSDIEQGLMMAFSLWFDGKRYERPTMTEEILQFDNYVITKKE